MNNIIDDSQFITANIDGNLIDVYVGIIKNFPQNIIDKYNINTSNLLCLRYKQGTSFKRHRHIKISDDHRGDLIIFPPCNLLNENLIGGDLIIYKEQEEIVKVDNLTEWTAVFLELEVDHEVTIIQSGTRYSFKCDYYV